MTDWKTMRAIGAVGWIRMTLATRVYCVFLIILSRGSNAIRGFSTSLITAHRSSHHSFQSVKLCDGPIVVHVCSGDLARSCIGVSAKLAISRGQQCSMQGIYYNFYLLYRDKSFAALNFLYQFSMARYCVIETATKNQLPSRAVPV